jgi:Putative transposase
MFARVYRVRPVDVSSQAFAAYLAPLRNSEWVVYSKRPFGGPEEVLRYLTRYTHRVAISNRRRLRSTTTASPAEAQAPASPARTSAMSRDAAQAQMSSRFKAVALYTPNPASECRHRTSRRRYHCGYRRRSAILLKNRSKAS